MQYFIKDKPNKELVDKKAESLAEEFVQQKYPDKPITSSQLRNFYGTCKRLESKFDTLKNSKESGEAFDEIFPHLLILKSKAEYAKSRKLVPPSFVEWLSQCLDAINNEKDFSVFMLHFEAVVGFCYGKGLKN